MNPVDGKEIPMNKTCMMSLSSIVVLLAVLGGCAWDSPAVNKAEHMRLFVVPPGAVMPGATDLLTTNSHMLRTSAFSGAYCQWYMPDPTDAPSMWVCADSSQVGLIFDLSILPQRLRVKRATLRLYRIETAPSNSPYVKAVKTIHPEYFFDHVVLGNLNSGYGYVESRTTTSDYGSSLVIEKAQMQDNEKSILMTLKRASFELSDKEHIRLAESSRMTPIWHTGEPFNEGGLVGYERRITYRDLIYHLMEDKTTQATHEGNWDLFDVTPAVQRDYQGDRQLLLVLMQYPRVISKDALSQVPLFGNAVPARFEIHWASPKNSPEVAPQIIVEFDTPDAIAVGSGQDAAKTKPVDAKTLLKEKLGELKDLLDEGIITQDEYERRRQSIIDKFIN